MIPAASISLRQRGGRLVHLRLYRCPRCKRLEPRRHKCLTKPQHRVTIQSYHKRRTADEDRA